MPIPADDPLYPGELRARADLTLAAILRALLVVLPILIAVAASGDTTPGGFAVICLALAFTLALYILQRRGHFVFCAHALVFGFIASSVAIIAQYGSVRSAGSMAMVASITLGGIFLGRRAMLLATALSVCSLGVLIYAENAGWLPVPGNRVTAAHWVIYSGIVVTVALVLSQTRTLLLDLVVQFGRELQERRKSEAARRQSEERFTRVFESSPVGMTITRLSDSRYLDTNRANERTLGYRREEMIGRTMLEMGIWLSAEDRARFVAELRAGKGVEGFDARVRNKAGEIVLCRIWAELLELDGEECVLSSTVNVTEQERAERLQRQSDAKYAAIFSSAPDPISITRERDSVTIEVNDAWVRITGHSREFAVGRSALKMGMWADQHQRAKVIEELQAKGAVHNIPARFTIAHGLTIEALLSGVRITLDDEPCVVWSWREVTELRKTQAQEEQIRAKFQALFETSPEGIAVTRLKDGVILEANEAAYAQLGFSRERTVGRSVFELEIGATAEDNQEILARLRAEGRVINRQTRFRRADGRWLALLLSAVTLKLDGATCIVWSWRDVTAQQLVEQELRSSRRLLENVIDAIPMSIFAKDVDSNYIMLNKRMAEFFGLPKEELLRRHTSRLPISGASRSKSLEDDAWVFGNLRTLEQPDVLLAHPDGRQIHYHSTKIPLFDEAGKLIGLLGVNRDITEQLRADATVRELNISLERRVRERTAELEAANRDLDSFGYSVSHDLRSPLGALNGFAHLLRTREAERLSPEGVHLLHQLETNATRMTNLVEGLLEFSRLGRKPVTRIPVPMAALVSEVVEELQAENRNRPVDFRIGEVAEAYGDPVLLRQVWRNLIGNAVKYSRGRDPAVVEVGSDPASGEYFVRDNGTGFDMQYASRLFGVFERLHSESEFEGTGIGLAIVQRVVNRHGGKVHGEGYPDRGATFRFTLPAR